MDIAMPIMDGIESSKKMMRSIKELKTNEVLTNIVAITSFDTKENREKCMNAGIK
jgi:CheY-like chemotaxis protein